MKPRDREVAYRIHDSLTAFDRDRRGLPGIHKAETRQVFQEQLLESIHRVQFVKAIRGREISGRRADPNDELFDPLKAAILHQRAGEVEEAFWLVFLFVHFGKSTRGGWRYIRDIYGRLGDGSRWDWNSTSANPAAFRAWLHAHQGHLRREGVPGGFGNHRKRERIDADSPKGTGAVVESYVAWVGPPRTHQQMVTEATGCSNKDPKKTFEYLYISMDAVIRFGRLARFDYLTMLGKMDLASIVPGCPYLEGSSGPRKGAALLFGSNESAEVLDQWVVELDDELHVGMQVLEDALCNWQKSPDSFMAFRG